MSTNLADAPSPNSIDRVQVMVSVGTDHHPFDRLVEWIDEWLQLNPNVVSFIQKGTSKAPQHGPSEDVVSHERLLTLFGQAIVVCHGGPATVMEARNVGALPIVVPRNPELGEHVDEHQMLFSRHLVDNNLAVVANTKTELFESLDRAIGNPESFTIPVKQQVSEGVVRLGEQIDRLLEIVTPLHPEDSREEESESAGRPEHLVDQSVTVVIATRDRPELLQRALNGVLAQNHADSITIIVVHDQSSPDPSLERSEQSEAGFAREVIVTTNSHSPGLAGARNTGIQMAGGSWVAFCDDDDEWLPGKLTAQFDALAAAPRARAACTGIFIHYEGKDTYRRPEAAKLTFDGFLRDRMTEAHPSSWLVHTDTLRSEIGLVDEDIPGGYGEDYDLFLRTARQTDIAVAEDPLVRIWWHGASFFFERWQTIDNALEYLVDKYPDFHRHPEGLARIRGQQAIAQAAMGRRSAALRTMLATARLRPLEKRLPVALAVLAGLPAEKVLGAAHRFGKGV